MTQPTLPRHITDLRAKYLNLLPIQEEFKAERDRLIQVCDAIYRKQSLRLEKHHALNGAIVRNELQAFIQENPSMTEYAYACQTFMVARHKHNRVSEDVRLAKSSLQDALLGWSLTGQ